MSTVNEHELQRDPLGLLSRVEAGESIVLTRGGRPVAEIRPLATATTAPRPYALAAGEFVVPNDFDEPLPDELSREFEGR